MAPPEESGRPDSNRRRPAWEAGILPLNYARDSCKDAQAPTERQRQGPGDSARGLVRTMHSVTPYCIAKSQNAETIPSVTLTDAYPPLGQPAPAEGNVSAIALGTTKQTE